MRTRGRRSTPSRFLRASTCTRSRSCMKDWCVPLAVPATADARDAVERTSDLAERLRFDLTQELGYRYPDFSDGEEPAIVQLRRVCECAFSERYAGLNGHKQRVRVRLEEELSLIEELGLAGF